MNRLQFVVMNKAKRKLESTHSPTESTGQRGDMDQADRAIPFLLTLCFYAGRN